MIHAHIRYPYKDLKSVAVTFRDFLLNPLMKRLVLNQQQGIQMKAFQSYVPPHQAYMAKMIMTIGGKKFCEAVPRYLNILSTDGFVTIVPVHIPVPIPVSIPLPIPIPIPIPVPIPFAIAKNKDKNKDRDNNRNDRSSLHKNGMKYKSSMISCIGQDGHEELYDKNQAEMAAKSLKHYLEIEEQKYNVIIESNATRKKLRKGLFLFLLMF